MWCYERRSCLSAHPPIHKGPALRSGVYEARRDVLSAPNFEHFDFDPEFMGCCLNLSGLMDRGGIADVGDYCQLMKISEHCAQEFNSLARKFDRLHRKTSNVATWFSQRTDHATANWVHSYREHDGDRRAYFHCGDQAIALLRRGLEV